MAKIPIGAERTFINDIPPWKRGKVRDTYELLDHNLLLPVATDRVSGFDFVLGTEVPQKGEVLTAMNVFWRTRPFVLASFNHDLVACGAGIETHLPLKLRGNPELQKRAVVIKKKKMCLFEAIARGYLTGSGLKAYNKTDPHTVCGHILPTGLYDGAKLPEPIFTPSTKAEVGHDEHITAESVRAEFGSEPEELTLLLYEKAQEYARSRGIIIADTKLELWRDASGFGIGDEVLTPDSSRFWDYNAWLIAQQEKKSPQALDKQFVRNYLLTLGVDQMDPKLPEHVEHVGSLTIPAEIIRMTTRLYRYVFWRLAECKLETFQREIMGIATSDPKPRIEVVVGSENNLPQIAEGLEVLKGRAVGQVSVLSCHRNEGELEVFARELLTKADVVIAGAGKAAALPGIIKSKLCRFNRPDIPVIGVAFESENASTNQAAFLSIECLPGQPVELRRDGKAYFGPEGFRHACVAAVEHEFLPKTFQPRPAQIGLLQFS